MPQIDGHSQQSQDIAVVHIGVAADPGEIQLACAQKVDDFPVAGALDERYRPFETALQIDAPGVDEGGLVIEENRRQADAQRRDFGSRWESRQNGECTAPPQLP